MLGSTQSNLAQIHDKEQVRMVNETDKDINIMKLKNDLRQTEQKHSSAKREVRINEMQRKINNIRFMMRG